MAHVVRPPLNIEAVFCLRRGQSHAPRIVQQHMQLGLLGLELRCRCLDALERAQVNLQELNLCIGDLRCDFVDGFTLFGTFFFFS